MDRKLTSKALLIAGLALLAAYIVYPPGETLRQGLDLAGGTSLIYEIDTEGLPEYRKKDLSTDMITVLRRRIDPHDIENLIWRPQGNTRFEIQMPLANAEAREKRKSYEAAKDKLLARNVSPTAILRSLQKPPQQRLDYFEELAKDSPERLTILQDLASVHDEYTDLRSQSSRLNSQLLALENDISAKDLNFDDIKRKVVQWSRLSKEELNDELKTFLASETNLDLLTRYTQTYTEWASKTELLTNPQTGKNILYKKAKNDLDKLSLTEDELNTVLELEPESKKRSKAVEKLKTDFPDRIDLIDNVLAAYDKYRPFRGNLDDPKDLQRMLKGAGILEWRILPTRKDGELSSDEIELYIDRLGTKGPKFASDNRYIWCELEDIKEWTDTFKDQSELNTSNNILGRFGDKYYVLASNQKDQIMLHTGQGRDWQLESAMPGRDPQTGQRAIDFALDEKGGKLFYKMSSANIGKPLCILLDDLAISAPNLRSAIRMRGQITGGFTQTEQNDLVKKLNAGSLPAKLIEQPLAVKSIGPFIGEDNRDKGIKAGLIGFTIVILCMLTYYTLAGSIADVALFMNLLFVLAIMAFVGATFTLPGIAGIILTIGMSVDANVLIFERIREEQQKGASLRTAIKNGYQRAFRAIFDANLTTFMTAAILLWVASEEIKGFAIVLMLGIASSMFTALFATRVIFDLLVSKKIIEDRLFMLRLIRKPNVNWMALRPVFLTISVLLVAAGLFVFFTRDDTKNNKYDIEFTGGTNLEINLIENANLTRQDVEDRIRKIGTELNIPALAAANVYSIGKTGSQYEINTTETNKTTATVAFGEDSGQTVETVASAIGNQLRNPGVTRNSQDAARFVVATSQTNKSLVRNVLSKTFPNAEISEPVVDEIVNNAILNAFEDVLQIRLNLRPAITSQEKVTEEIVNSYPELTDYLGGIKLTCEIEKAVTAEEINQRFKDLRYKPDTRDLNLYSYEILGPQLNPAEPNQPPLNSFVYLSVHPEAGLRTLSEDEWARFVENETTKVIAATQLEGSLPRVTQIDPSVGSEAKTKALIAIALSLFAIITYIWIRFGDVRYGVAAIMALVHDVSITLGAVTACTYLAGTTIGQTLLIGDFKINLAVIAAFLTLIGYSLNDTIVVFDRIRENRHKAQLKPQTITDSINQTLSRTLLTSFTTFIVVLIMYIFGGQALRGFTFAIGFGVIVGTYSSIAIAAPILLIGTKTQKE